MNTFPKYSLEELVNYQGMICRVVGIHAVNWQSSNPFIYSIIVFDPNYEKDNKFKQILVKELLVNKASNKQIKAWKAIYECPKGYRKEKTI